MPDAITLSLGYTYNGQEMREIFAENVFRNPDIRTYFRVLDNVRSKKQMQVRSGTMGKVLRNVTGCTLAENGTLAISNRTLEVANVGNRFSQCYDQFADTIWEEALNRGVDIADLTNTQIMSEVVMPVIMDTIRNNVMDLAWWSKNGATASGYDGGFDGIFELFTASGSGIGTVDVADYATVSGVLNTDAAESVFDKLIREADNTLRAVPANRKAIFVTPELYYNYEDTLRSGDTEFSKITLVNGVQVPAISGIGIIPMWDWGTALDDTDNPLDGTFKFDHLALYTAYDNIVLGSDTGLEGTTELKVFYDEKDRKNYVDTQFKMGAQFVFPELSRIAYFH